MKELVSAIENGLKKISKGNITLIELEETVASSRELYERLLIVRYKVYENSILAVEESEELEVVDKETEEEKEEGARTRATLHGRALSALPKT